MDWGPLLFNNYLIAIKNQQMASSDELKSPFAFDSQNAYCDHFWKHSANLVGILNVSESKDRGNYTLQTYSQGKAPCVYGVVVNKSIVVDDKFHFWKLLKIGKTAVDTTTSATKSDAKPPKNRMESS